MTVERDVDTQWEYCTMIVAQSQAEQMLAVTILKPTGLPEAWSLGTTQIGAAIARLGSEGWEMCGFYTVPLSDGLGQQFYFKRLLIERPYWPSPLN